MKHFLLSLLLLLVCFLAKAQSNCAGAAPFCTGTTYNFPASTNIPSAQTGPDYGCLGSTPNPAWYYLQIAQNGPIIMSIGGANSGDDIDFVCWGPFTSPTAGCAGGLTSNCSPGCLDNTAGGVYPSGNMVDCSYDIQAVETCTIPNAVIGQYYMVMITNFGGNATNIIFTQTNTGATGAGATNCNILCNITSMTAVPGPCVASTNSFNVTGTINTYAPPSSGTLTISSSCGGSVVFNAPFTAVTNYTLTGVPATGGNCVVTASYSADPLCTFTLNVAAPAPCNVNPCSLTSVTANPGACNPANNAYDATGSVTFINPPSSGTLNITSSCGGSVSLNAPFTSPLTYTLTGLPSNGATCTVTAVFSADATCTNTVTMTAPPPCATCTTTASNNGPVCEGQTLNLTCSTVGATSYAWAGPNSYTASVQNPNISNATPAANGIYTVTVTAANGAICTATTTVTINPSPNADAGQTVTICTGGSVTLNASGGTSYSWTPATGLSNNAISNPVASPAATTQYSVTVGSNGCFANDTVTVFVVAQLNATVSPNTTICSGIGAQLTAGGGSAYQWTPATGLSAANISNPVANPAVTTTYSVIVSAGGGCPNDTAVVTVTVVPALNVVTSVNDTVCAGQTGTVYASGAAAYVWLPGGSTGDTLHATPSATQTYTVIGSAGTCVDSATVSISVLPLPVADFSAAAQTELGNYQVCFTNTSSNYVDPPCIWVLDTTTITQNNVCHDFVNAGVYNVCLTVQNSLGCPNTYCENIELKPDWSFYIPNAFTPDGNGVNDVFYAYGTNLSKFEMYVFDRWGQQVFHTTDVNEGWNGRMNNKGADIVQIDTYVWRVKFTDTLGKVRKYTGHVTVVK